MPIKDAFRRGIGHAVQWYDSLRVRMEKEVDSAIKVADGLVDAETARQSNDSSSDSPCSSVPSSSPLPSPTPPTPTPVCPGPPPQRETFPSLQTDAPPALTPGQCARILRQRCPACFGLDTWGRSFQEYVSCNLSEFSLSLTTLAEAETSMLPLMGIFLIVTLLARETDRAITTRSTFFRKQ